MHKACSLARGAGEAPVIEAVSAQLREMACAMLQGGRWAAGFALGVARVVGVIQGVAHFGRGAQAV